MDERGLNRRRFLAAFGAVAGAAALTACGANGRPAATPEPRVRPRNAEEAIARLLAGNGRFAAGRLRSPDRTAARRSEVAAGQRPWAVIVGCVDSRVPPEILFDEGLGDLLVVRTAGQVIDDAVQASIDFGVEEFEAPLVMVLGHEKCGAVTATVGAVDGGAGAAGSLAPIVNAIRPAVEEARRGGGDIVDNAVRENVRRQVQRLRSSPVVVAAKATRVVGARYDLDRGIVDVIV